MKGFFRLAAAVPVIKVGDPAYNAQRIAQLYADASEEGAAVVVFPELAITGYTCGDMFEQRALTLAAEDALRTLVARTAQSDTALIVGVPIRVETRLFNAAAVIAKGKLLGFPLKEYLPNYREFYEKRQFSSARDFSGDAIVFDGEAVPAGSGLVFCADNGLRFGVEICEDLWAVVPPSSTLAVGGAHAIFNPSAGTELVAKSDYRRSLVTNQSARISGAYVLAGAGVHESTSDAVFGGHALIADNGTCRAESKRFSRTDSLVFADVRPAWCDSLRAAWTSFNDSPQSAAIRRIAVPALRESPDMKHLRLAQHPFVPDADAERSERCHEILEIQSAGLAKRIEHTGAKRLVIGLSGGLDSALALLVCVWTCEKLGLPPAFVCAVTMPGFGTSARTLANAEKLAAHLGVELRTIDIRAAVLQHFADIGHDKDTMDVVYENAQARERTQILMDLANAECGLLVGTGDLSEIALGWNTFNGDHMSMYNVNCAVPKTLVRHIVAYYAGVSGADLRDTLLDILDTPVSPELLPGEQHTETLLGRYDLHDFFLYYFLKYGEPRDTLVQLACEAFKDTAQEAEIRAAADTFLRRFISQQFKRNASPDGPKIGAIALSPRADLRCPADMSAAAFIAPAP